MKLIQNTLSRFVSSGQIAGCAIRIVRNDEPLFEGSFGYADIESKVPMSSENTIFRIASCQRVSSGFQKSQDCDGKTGRQL